VFRPSKQVGDTGSSAAQPRGCEISGFTAVQLRAVQLCVDHFILYKAISGKPTCDDVGILKTPKSRCGSACLVICSHFFNGEDQVVRPYPRDQGDVSIWRRALRGFINPKFAIDCVYSIILGLPRAWIVPMTSGDANDSRLGFMNVASKRYGILQRR
jgi:hypothetical protein